MKALEKVMEFWKTGTIQQFNQAIGIQGSPYSQQRRTLECALHFQWRTRTTFNYTRIILLGALASFSIGTTGWEKVSFKVIGTGTKIGEDFFDAFECDLCVPNAFRENLGEFCSLSRIQWCPVRTLGETISEFAEKRSALSRPQRKLICSLHAAEILLGTPLLKWYLEHHLRVTTNYQAEVYVPVACFQPFGNEVT